MSEHLMRVFDLALAGLAVLGAAIVLLGIAVGVLIGVLNWGVDRAWRKQQQAEDLSRWGHA